VLVLVLVLVLVSGRPLLEVLGRTGLQAGSLWWWRAIGDALMGECVRGSFGGEAVVWVCWSLPTLGMRDSSGRGFTANDCFSGGLCAYSPDCQSQRTL
jgi:hypothetical protein